MSDEPEQVAKLRATDRRAVKAIMHRGRWWPAGDIVAEPSVVHPDIVRSFGDDPVFGSSSAYKTTMRRLLNQSRPVLAVIDYCGGRPRNVTLVVESVQHPRNYLGALWGGGLGLRLEAATVYEDVGRKGPNSVQWYSRPRDTIRSFLTEADWENPSSPVCEVRRLAGED